MAARIAKTQVDTYSDRPSQWLLCECKHSEESHTRNKLKDKCHQLIRLDDTGQGIECDCTKYIDGYVITYNGLVRLFP